MSSNVANDRFAAAALYMTRRKKRPFVTGATILKNPYV